jgi:hypothetical protein
MSSDTTSYTILAGLGTLIIALMAGGYYYANSETEPYGRPTGMAIYQQPNQMGGKKTRRKNHRIKKTRRNLQ